MEKDYNSHRRLLWCCRAPQRNLPPPAAGLVINALMIPSLSQTDGDQTVTRIPRVRLLIFGQSYDRNNRGAEGLEASGARGLSAELHRGDAHVHVHRGDVHALP